MAPNHKGDLPLVFATSGEPMQPCPLVASLLDFLTTRFEPDFVSHAIRSAHRDGDDLTVTWTGLAPAYDGTEALLPLRDAIDACWSVKPGGDVKHRLEGEE